MIKAVFGGLAQIVAKPQVLIAGIITAIIQFMVLLFALEPLSSLAENVLLLGNVPNVSLLELPFQFYRMYFNEINLLLIAFLISLILQLWLGIVIARFAVNLQAKKAGILEAIGFGIKGLGKIIGAVVFLLAIVGIFFAVFQFLVWLSDFSTEASIILTTLLLILAAYVFIKLVFFVPIMGCKEANVKTALEEAWEFGKNKFWKILALLVIVAIVSAVIEMIGTLASDAIANDIISAAVLSLFSIIATTYSALVLANYYLNHQSSGGKFYYEERHRRKRA
jgi:hypothetical protein